MDVTASQMSLQMSPQKVRLVVDLIRGKKAADSLAMLKFVDKAAAKPIAKTLKSAIHNATHNFNLKAEDLFVKTIVANSAPMARRMQPRSHGQADRIHKRATHLMITVSDKKL